MYFTNGVGPGFESGDRIDGLFWIVQVPDDAVKVTDDTVTISLKNVAIVDQHQFNFRDSTIYTSWYMAYQSMPT